MHISEFQWKNQEKVFRFSDNSVWICCRKFCILRKEYFSSAVSVLANSLKIYDHSKADFSNWLYLEFMG